MSEVFNASIFGFNIVISVLLVLIIVYWLSMIIGVVDNDSVDAHFEAQIDGAEGILHSILVFFKLGEIPLMLTLTLTTLFAWAFSVAGTITFNYGIILSTILFIPYILLGALVSKVLLLPFKDFLIELKGKDAVVDLINKICTLTTDLESGRIGQAEVKTDGAPILITVTTSDGKSMKRGDSAVVIIKNDKNSTYEIKLIKDLIHLDEQGGNS
jgi:hypothetical protein